MFAVLPIHYALFLQVPDVRPQGLVLGLVDEVQAVLGHLLWVDQASTSSQGDLLPSLAPSRHSRSRSFLELRIAVVGVARVSDHVWVVGRCSAHAERSFVLLC